MTGLTIELIDGMCISIKIQLHIKIIYLFDPLDRLMILLGHNKYYPLFVITTLEIES